MAETTSTLEAVEIPLAALRANPDNVRAAVRRSDAEFKELVASVAAHGIVQALTVVPDPENPDGYMIVAGHRRSEAAEVAGLSVVPGIVRRDLDPAKITEIALIENLQRTDLTPVEEARGYFRLVALGEGRTAKEIAKQVGRSAKYVGERLALLELPKAVLDSIDRGAIALGQVKWLRAALDAGIEPSSDAFKELVEIAREGRDVEYAAGRAINKAKSDAVLAEIREKCESRKIPFEVHRGVGSLPPTIRLLDPKRVPSYYQIPEFTAPHKGEPCEGICVVLPSYGNDAPLAIKACLDFDRHKPKGASEVKVKKVEMTEAEKAAKEADRAVRAKAAEAAAARREILSRTAQSVAVGSTEARAFVVTVLLARCNVDQIRATATLLGIEPEEIPDPYGTKLKSGETKKIKDFDTPLVKYTKESNANLTRAGVAAALVMSDEFYYYGRADNFTNRAKRLRNELAESITGEPVEKGALLTCPQPGCDFTTRDGLDLDLHVEDEHPEPDEPESEPEVPVETVPNEPAEVDPPETEEVPDEAAGE